MRGNSGSGNSTVARAPRSRLTGSRLTGRVAWVEQDYLRCVVLHEHEFPTASTSA
jgi:hypothetical protein